MAGADASPGPTLKKGGARRAFGGRARFPPGSVGCHRTMSSDANLMDVVLTPDAVAADAAAADAADAAAAADTAAAPDAAPAPAPTPAPAPAPAPAVPVKMMNPWLAYCKETRPDVRHLGPQQQVREKDIMWKAMSDEEKAPFCGVPKG